MKLELDNISKLYGDTIALAPLTLSLTPGIYGLLGPNGAGKTTLMRIITDLLAPSSGRVLLDGQDVVTMGSLYRKHLGYLPQDFGYYPNETVERFLQYIGILKGMKKSDSKRQTEMVLRMVGLEEKRKEKLKKLSGGQRQRVGIAQVFMANPDILILDEPTAGLDPEERIRFRNMLSGLSQQKIVLLATHIVSDLEAIANEIILLKQGKVLYVDTPSELLMKLEGKVWTVTVPVNAESKLTESYPCSNILHTGEQSVLRLISDSKPTASALPVSPNMEDLYLYYFEMGR